MPLLFLSRDLGNPDFLEANLRLAPVSEEAPSLAVPCMHAGYPEVADLAMALLL
jgi:hypothetical protein